MRESIKDFVQLCTETLPIVEPIYEFGSLQVEGQEGFADLRSFFPGKAYIGADIREGPGVDLLIDLHSIDLPSYSVGTALMLDTIEHVEYPRQAIHEISRVLRPGGIVIISSVMNFRIHNHPSDYWRFTPEGFRSLLREFPFSLVESAGNQSFPHTVVAVACAGTISQDRVGRLRDRLAEWQAHWKYPTGHKWREHGRLLIPPIMGHLTYRLRHALDDLL